MRFATLKKMSAKSKDAFQPISVALIVTLSVVGYINTLGNSFVYDDYSAIVNNEFIKDWRHIPKFFSIDYFWGSDEASYRPIVTLSYLVDYSIWRLNPIGYHLTNLIIHIINAILFYILINLVFKDIAASLIATLFFIVHPALTEAVNGISYREDLLCSLFMLGSIISFVKFSGLISNKSCHKDMATPACQFTSRSVSLTSWRRKAAPSIIFAISLISYFFALFSKEMAITLPLLLFLIVLYLKLQDRFKPSQKIICLSGYLFIALFYLFIRFMILCPEDMQGSPNITDYNILENLIIMAKLLSFYVGLLFFPVKLNADYVITTSASVSDPYFILSSLMLVTICIITIKIKRFSGNTYFSILWFAISILPVANIAPIENIVAERYLYIPSMGFFIFIGTALANGLRCNGIFKKARLGMIITILLIVSAIFLCSFKTINRNKIWKDELTFWTKTLKDSPDSCRAYNSIGNLYKQQGDIGKAMVYYKEALDRNPSYAVSHYNLGVAYQEQGALDNAAREYETAIGINANYADAYNNLAAVYYAKGQLEQAIERYKKLLNISPGYPDAHYNLGLIYQKQGLLDEALQHFESAIKLKPNYGDAYINIGTIYYEKGLLDKSIQCYKQAIENNGNDAAAYNNLGISYSEKGLLEEAIKAYKTAIRINNSLAEAHYNLGCAYQQRGEIEDAINEFKETLRLDANHVEARERYERLEANQ